jgi:cytochrome c1
VHLTTKAGTALSGIRMNEDTYSIQVRDRGNRLHSFWKADLKELRLEQKTLMPSYSQQLTAQEIDDVVAYLTQLRGIQ